MIAETYAGNPNFSLQDFYDFILDAKMLRLGRTTHDYVFSLLITDTPPDYPLETISSVPIVIDDTELEAFEKLA